MLPPGAAAAAGPPRPQALHAAERDGGILLSWRISRQVSRIRVYRRRERESWPRSPIATLKGGARRFVDHGIRDGQTYYYRLRAVSRSGRHSRPSLAVRARALSRGSSPGTTQPQAKQIADPGPAPSQAVTEPAPAGHGPLPGAEGCASFGPYHAGSHPPACWRPYSAGSPFNRVVPSDPRLDRSSAAIVARLLSWGKPQTLLIGHSGLPNDYFHPLYYAHENDPLFTVQ